MSRQARVASRLKELTPPSPAQTRRVVVLGGAVGDELLSVEALPQSGGDIEATFGGAQIGGCGFNVVRILAQLKIAQEPALVIGNGPWADQISAALERLGIASRLHSASRDNGWCLALVEPHGERTFINVPGAENDWGETDLSALEIAPDDIVYVSGYELFNPDGQALRALLASLPPEQTILYDLGPSCDSLEDNISYLWLRPGVILTLNDREYTDLNTHAVLTRLADKPGALVHRRGAKDTLVFTGDLTSIDASLPCYRVEVADTVGAGDSHAAGTLAALSLGFDLAEACIVGNAVAAISCTHTGADVTLGWSDVIGLIESQPFEEA